jgi:hypothetical protein
MYNLLQKHPDNVFKKGVLNQLIIAAVLSPMLSQNKVVVIVDSASNHSVQFNKSQTQSAKKHYLHVHYLQYLTYGAHVYKVFYVIFRAIRRIYATQYSVVTNCWIPKYTGLLQIIVVQVGVKTECKIYGCQSI